MQGYDDAIASDNPFDSASIEYAGTAFGHRVVAVRQRWSAALTISRAFWNILSVPINRSLILRPQRIPRTTGVCSSGLYRWKATNDLSLGGPPRQGIVTEKRNSVAHKDLDCGAGIGKLLNEIRHWRRTGPGVPTGLQNRPLLLISRNRQPNLRLSRAAPTPELADSGEFRSQKRIQCAPICDAVLLAKARVEPRSTCSAFFQMRRPVNSAN
jgi:hypothetical protein